MNYLFNLKIATPTEVLFKGQVFAVSSANSQGNFDILANHANFLTIIDNKSIKVILPDKNSKSFTFHQAIIYAEKNNVIIFADPDASRI
jgi:F0F1-type ATP synthase epsilon subunit